LGSVTSSNAALIRIDVPIIFRQPTNQTVIVGRNVSMILLAFSNSGISFQWDFNGTNIVGATNSSLVLTNVQLNQSGTYFAQVSTAYTTVTSSNATFSVYASAVPVMNAFAFSPDSGVTFSVTGVPAYHYSVQASTNLIDWVSLITNSSPFNFTDTNLNFPQRFYRSVYLP